MTKKHGPGIKFGYFATEEEKYKKRKAKQPDAPIRKGETGIKFPSGAFVVADNEGNVFIGKQDPLTKRITNHTVIKSKKIDTSKKHR